MNEKNKGFEAIPQILGQFQSERAYLGEFLMKQLFEAMPWGKEFNLPNGASATLKKFIEPRRPPIYAEELEPNDDPNVKTVLPEPIGYKPWEFGFDFKLKNCDQDHIEVMVTITGGGGAC